MWVWVSAWPSFLWLTSSCKWGKAPHTLPPHPLPRPESWVKLPELSRLFLRPEQNASQPTLLPLRAAQSSGYISTDLNRPLNTGLGPATQSNPGDHQAKPLVIVTSQGKALNPNRQQRAPGQFYLKIREQVWVPLCLSCSEIKDGSLIVAD